MSHVDKSRRIGQGLAIVLLLLLAAVAHARHAANESAPAPRAPPPTTAVAPAVVAAPAAPAVVAAPAAPAVVAAPAAPAVVAAPASPAAKPAAPAPPTTVAPPLAAMVAPISNKQVKRVLDARTVYTETAERLNKILSDEEFKPVLHMPGELFVFLDSGDIAHLTARAESKGKRFSDVGLFLNGVFLNGASPRREPLPLNIDMLRFTISFNELDAPKLNKILVEQGYTHITVSVGFEDGEMMLSHWAIDILPTTTDRYLALALALAMAAALFFAVTRTSMLKEQGQGVSLGRTQMVWWTLLAAWAYFYLYQFTGTAQMTKSVVILMGISSATALAAVFIDRRKEEGKPEAVPPAPHADPPRRVHSFLSALLADPADPAQGPSVHRAQILLWTLIMTYVFLDSVIGRLVMPEFDNTVLALMGVSSGTYLGFKVPEKAGGAAPSSPTAAAPAVLPTPPVAPAPVAAPQPKP